MILVELEDRDETRRCFARTRRFNVCARAEFAADPELSEVERRAVDQIVALVRAREDGLPEGSSEPVRRAQLREILVERVLVPEGPRRYYLNAYSGCAIGCGFCYVAERADLSRRLAGLPSVPWGAHVDVKVNAAEVLRREIESGRFPPGLVRMSPILTDPYQPLERTYRITRSCLEVLLGAGFTPAILTRAARVTEDLELLRRFERAAIGFSIPTDDDRVRRLFEPRADSVDARIDALRACREARLLTCVVIQPMLPMNPARLVELVAPLVRAVRIDRMHSMDRVAAVYEKHGLLDAATDEFFESTRAALVQGFRARSVKVDEADDLTGLLFED